MKRQTQEDKDDGRRQIRRKPAGTLEHRLLGLGDGAASKVLAEKESEAEF